MKVLPVAKNYFENAQKENRMLLTILAKGHNERKGFSISTLLFTLCVTRTVQY